MASLLYLHGFLSSPLSYKARQVKSWLAQHRPTIHYHCPLLTPYPEECATLLSQQIATLESPVGVIGSSMGGFWATWLVEHFGLKAVLINPAVSVLELTPAYVNRTVSNYHLPQNYYLEPVHLQQLKRYITAKPQRLQNYWLLLQTGDETLDYRLAVEKYQGCRQTVEIGGNHAFQHLERHLDATIRFLFE
ncbi:MAG: putative esterase YcpF (UPF0227 family) [Cellvibrionaceae bacterium]|jgi:predicted esterase YcpF (UPF0227 family)